MIVRPDTTSESLFDRLGRSREEELRSSSYRRRYLEKVAKIVTRENVQVTLVDYGARCTRSASSRHDASIYIGTDRAEQPLTDLPERAWTLLRQETLLFHEIGHVLYTDFDRMEERVEELDRYDQQKAFKFILNAAEDSCIETQLSKEYQIKNDLITLHANLAEASKSKLQESAKNVNNGGQRECSIIWAIGMGLLDMGVYDSGRLATLLDRSDHTLQVQHQDFFERIVPHMRLLMAYCLRTKDGAERVDRVYEFFQHLLDMMREEDKTTTAEDYEQREGRPDDVENGKASAKPTDADDLGDDETVQVRVSVAQSEEGDDSQQSQDAEQGENDAEPEEGSVGGAPRDPDEDDAKYAEEEEDEERAGSGPQGPQEDDDTDAQDEDSSSQSAEGQEGQQEESDEDVDGDEGESDEDDDDVDESEDESASEGGDGDELDDEVAEAEEEIHDKYTDEISRQDHLADEDPLEDEASEIRDALEKTAGIGGLEEVEVLEGAPKESWNKNRWISAKKDGQKLTSILRAQLQRERESETLREQRQGQLDDQRLYAVPTGSNRVFTQERQPEEKDYRCIICLDRSTSMSLREIKAAENAAAQLAYAFDEVGIDVSIFGMYQNRPVLEVPFGADLEVYADRFMNARLKGGTPLGDMTELLRHRIGRLGEGEQPFMIVLTDGQPNKGQREKYKEELRAANFPVFGVYIDEKVDRIRQQRKHAEYFDRIVYSDISTITTKVKRLANEMVM